MEPLSGGLRLGHYELVRLLGSGGMGEVYLARDLELDRNVAIKFVRHAESSKEDLTARFLQEAQAVAALDHTGICAVYDLGIDDSGRRYMVMPYIEGETLSSRLVRGPLSPRESLMLCGRIAEALAVAHDHAIIHRDLKPQNIMLTSAGLPKLLDFGVAKWLPSIGPAATTVSGLTAPHAIVGTPGYLSPEQVQQRPVDARTDLFALGAILFECLTGRRAFDGGRPVEAIAQVLHVRPPDPSTLRSDLDGRHDEICRRLLEKDPVDRFQSAQEVLSAIQALLQDSSTARPAPVDSHAGFGGWVRRHRSSLTVATVLFVAAMIGVWAASRPKLPAVPSEAERWYERGTEALFDGAFQSATTALEQAVRVFPDYPVAYARLAEARAELDDESGAQRALLNVADRLPNESRLPTNERLRLTGVRSLVLREIDDAVRAYSELVGRRPTDPAAWLDLGRAQEAGAQLGEARASYERAVATDNQYPAAHLRLGILAAAEGRRDDSLAAYAEAERLYKAASRQEGEAEVLIRRGSLFDTLGQFRDARGSLGRALTLAQTIESPFHVVRAQMHLSSVTASEGRLAEAEQMAADAVKTALEAGLETVAAEGLIDLGGTLIYASKPAEAESALRRALELARKRDAKRTVARAMSQLASLQLDNGHPAAALETLQPSLDFFKQRRFRRYELTALSIASRAYERLDDIPRAHALATEVLAVAESMKSEVEIALALGSLAAQATTLGSLPEALTLRQRAEAIHQRQNDRASRPYDLTNRAELLIRLGQGAAADLALQEVEAGIVQKLDGYAGRERRVKFLRALAASAAARYSDAASFAGAIRVDPKGTDSASVLGPALQRYAEARTGRKDTVSAIDEDRAVPPALWRERQYWRAATALSAGISIRALELVKRGLERNAGIGNDELEWRLAAVGCVAAGQLKSTEEEQALRARASAALARIRSGWGTLSGDYDKRPDLVELRKVAGL